MSLHLLAATLVLVGAIFAAGFAVAVATGTDAKRRSLPAWVQVLIGAVAVGVPWTITWAGLVPDIVVDRSVFALAASVALWVGLPLLAVRFVEAPADRGQPC